MKYCPRKYQAYATQHIIDHSSCGLFLDMGLGKTVSTLTAIELLKYDYCEVDRVLVIAPKRVAEITWPEEVKKWDHLRDLTIQVIAGTPAERKHALNKNCDIFTISRDNVQWLIDALGGSWPFDMLVIDELSSFKSPKAKRFRALKKVKSKRVVGLTGTPGSLLDLWAQIYLLDHGERLGKSITGFRNRYFTPGKRNGNIVYEWLPLPGASKAIENQIRDICVSMSQEDYIELPKLIEETIYVEMSSDVKKQYQTLVKTHVLQLVTGKITASNAAVVSGLLQQLANGAIYVDAEDHEFKELHDEKLTAVEEILESTSEPVLVYYKFIHDKDRLMTRFKEARTLCTAQDIKDWNAGKIKIALAHPMSIGHGLNLQSGGHIIVWFGLDWWLEGYQQANARLFRSGQQKPVLVYHVVTRGTIDERIIKVLAKKEIAQNAILEAVKAELKEVKE